MANGDGRRRALEEAVRLLESVRADSEGGRGFDDARVDGHVATALTAARAALAVANRGAADHEANREANREGPTQTLDP